MQRDICVFLAAIIAVTAAVPITNEVFSLDNVQEEGGKILSLTVDPDTKTVGLTAFNVVDGDQKVLLRQNTDNTFTLFPNTQPFNWVDYIVETTRYVRIPKIPQVLTAVGSTEGVVEQNYQGKSASSQKWYLVPTGSDPNTGVVTNLSLRLCLVGQGENQPLTLATCNWSDPNQIFNLSVRSIGRRA